MLMLVVWAVLMVIVVTWYILLDSGTRHKYCGSHWKRMLLNYLTGITYLCVTSLKIVLFPGLNDLCTNCIT